MMFKNLPGSVNKADANCREAVQTAASLAGLAWSNAFVGVATSMTHQLCATFDLPHGLAISFVICQVVKFNAEDAPSWIGTFPQLEQRRSVPRLLMALA
eukprot:CAMPEP_0113859188 /NCGR_PEP_ID=MMETSP0372-20130328/12033_1 /TAXON_ID=340204 /ORGANISM="Lankesteria abbotti" /LENGTH=98 /DNA_ID=CAMNT_0000837033 /DNA_START=856 /DNA_END=1152 /DNA_ORIENTATION=- /assembly_acc=CAM_ASM_000359